MRVKCNVKQGTKRKVQLAKAASRFGGSQFIQNQKETFVEDNDEVRIEYKKFGFYKHVVVLNDDKNDKYERTKYRV